MGGAGGHSDTAAGAKLTMIVAPLFRARLPIVVDQVLGRVHPGDTVDVLVTQRGIAVNPAKPQLKAQLEQAGLPVYPIQELREMAQRLTGRASARTPGRPGGGPGRIPGRPDHRRDLSNPLTERFCKEEPLESWRSGNEKNPRRAMTMTGAQSPQKERSGETPPAGPRPLTKSRQRSKNIFMR